MNVTGHSHSAFTVSGQKSRFYNSSSVQPTLSRTPSFYSDANTMYSECSTLLEFSLEDDADSANTSGETLSLYINQDDAAWAIPATSNRKFASKVPTQGVPVSRACLMDAEDSAWGAPPPTCRTLAKIKCRWFSHRRESSRSGAVDRAQMMDAEDSAWSR